MGDVRFCSAFDEALALRGPPAVFLPDREGQYRFDADWTRDVWERAGDVWERAGDGPQDASWTFLLLRDRDTGFVNLLLVTSASLLREHPRAEVRAYPSLEAASAARARFGRPPIARESAW